MNWSILIIYLILTTLSFWAASKFLGNNGIALFSVLFAVLTTLVNDAVLFGHRVNISAIVFPFVFLAFLSYDEQYDRKTALELLYTVVAALAVVMVFGFFECVFTNINMLDWMFLGTFVSVVISVWVAGLVALKLKPFVHKLKFKEPVILCLDLAVISFIDSLIFVGLAYIGMMSFGHIVLTILINWLVRAVVCVVVVLMVVALRKYESKQLKVGLEIEEPVADETHLEASNEQTDTQEEQPADTQEQQTEEVSASEQVEVDNNEQTEVQVDENDEEKLQQTTEETED